MKNVNKYKGIYQVTKDGRVWSKIRSRFLNGWTTLDGYRHIELVNPITGKHESHLLHRLVAQTYIPNPKNLKTVNHKNGIKTDNRVDNLEWCTQKENIKHAWRTGLAKPRYDIDHHLTKLTLKQIKEILPRIDGKYGTLSKIAREYNVSPSLLSLIGKGYRTT